MRWDESKIDFFTSLLQTSSVVGLTLGSLSGGMFIKYGRRKALINFNMIGLIGSLLSLYLNIWSMCVGRLIFGFSAGVMLCAAPTMIEETIPEKFAEKGFGTSTNILVNVGAFICMVLSTGLPQKKEELVQTNYWML